jgi:hypothetical protein
MFLLLGFFYLPGVEVEHQAGVAYDPHVLLSLQAGQKCKMKINRMIHGRSSPKSATPP